MLKTKNKFIFKRLQNMKIANKITILYGGIFSLSIIIISVIIMGNAVMVNENAVRQEITSAINAIEKKITSGEEINEESYAALLENSYVGLSIVNMVNGDTYSNTLGNIPQFIITPERLIEGVMGPPSHGEFENTEGRPPFEPSEIKENLIQGFDSASPQDINENKIREFKNVGNNSKAYIIQSDNRNEVMLVQKVVSTENDVYFIQAYKSYSGQMSYFYGFAFRLLIIDAICILLAFLIGRYISRLILKPVENIRQTAERISIEDLSRRIEISGPEDEMSELTVTFNSMIDRLEGAFDKQNQFISDASHELKTPISVIQGYANLINRWGKSDPNVLQESIDSIIAETEHMGTLTKKLLFLAKSDQNKMLLQKQNISLNEVTKEVIKELNVMNVERKIEFEEKDEVVIFADFDLIKRLLWIYTDNSIKYTKEGETIKFDVYSDGKYGNVSVSDNGTGMDQDQLPFIFDRFYRVDKSRNKEIPGTGLGLSIAKWIVEAHEGEIILESELGKGSKFINKFVSV